MPLCSDGVHDMFTESKVRSTLPDNVLVRSFVGFFSLLSFFF